MARYAVAKSASTPSMSKPMRRLMLPGMLPYRALRTRRRQPRASVPQRVVVLEEPLIRALDAPTEMDLVTPPECVDPGYIQELSRGAIRFRRIEDEGRLRVYDVASDLRQFAN